MSTLAIQALISAISQSTPLPASIKATEGAIQRPSVNPSALSPESLQNSPAALKLFITQAANIGQPARIYLFLLGNDMKIADLIANPKLAIEQTRSQMLSQLRPGQTLQASVVEPPQQGIARLRVGGSELMVRTLLPLATGEQLLMDVTKGKNGNIPDLRLIQQPTMKHYQARALRNLLPQQIPLQKLVEQIRQLSVDNPRLPGQGGENSRISTPLANPVSKESLPHRQLIQTLRSLAPETVGSTLINKGKNSDNSSGRSVLDRALPGRGHRFSSTDQLLQRLAGTQQGSTTTTPARGGSTPLAPSAPHFASITTALGRDTLSLPSYPAAAPQVLTKLASAIAAHTIGKPSSLPTPNPTLASTQAPVQKSLLSDAVIKQIETVLNHGVRENDPLTASRIRELFGTSGLFLESSLASGTTPTSDLKASLLHLLFHLRPGGNPKQAALRGGQQQTGGGALQSAGLRLLAELQSLAEGALARVQINQLSSLPQEDGNRQVWQFELPFVMPKGTDSFLIRIERDGDNCDDNGAAGWSVTLNFDIDPIGPMSAKLSLAEDEISSHFTAHLEESAKLVEKALPRLAEAYLRAGLKVGKLSCRQGVPEEINSQPPRIDLPLLDEKA